MRPCLKTKSKLHSRHQMQPMTRLTMKQQPLKLLTLPPKSLNSLLSIMRKKVCQLLLKKMNYVLLTRNFAKNVHVTEVLKPWAML